VFTVLPGEGGAAATISRPDPTDVEQLDRDIRYIRTGDLELRPMGSRLFGSWSYVAGMGAPLVLLVLFLLWRRRYDAEHADVAGMRRKGADKVARQRLKAAAEALARGERDGFYTALAQALNGYLADRYTLAPGEVTARVARERLAPHGDAAGKYAALMEACELARFAPVEDRPRQQVYDEAVELIARIENNARA
jgi:hypothetical protein